MLTPYRLTTEPMPATVNHLLLEIISQVQPEIQARQLALDFDLDEVPIRGNLQAISAAIHCVMITAIEHSAQRGEISINLIDGNDSWDLEIAIQPDADREDQLRRECSAKSSPWPSWLPNSRLSRAQAAILTCGGNLELWRCPQGGVAIVLQMPQRALGSIRLAA